MALIDLSNYKPTFINNYRTQLLLTKYTNQNEGKIANDFWSTWKSQVENITPQDIDWIMANATLPPTMMNSWLTSFTDFVFGKVTDGWSGVAEVGVEQMNENLDRVLGIDLSTSAKAKAAEYWSSPFVIDFPELAASMENWIDLRRSYLTEFLTAEQATSVTQLIQRGVVQEGINGTDLGKQLKDVVGLTPREETALSNYRVKLLNAGVAKDRVDSLASTYSNKLKRRRGNRIGRTELSHAYNAANHTTMEQAIVVGDIQQPVVKKFYAAQDERTCQMCNDLHGKVIGMADKWRSATEFNIDQEAQYPPVHVHCRCVVIYTLLGRKV